MMMMTEKKKRMGKSNADGGKGGEMRKRARAAGEFLAALQTQAAPVIPHSFRLSVIWRSDYK